MRSARFLKMTGTSFLDYAIILSVIGMALAAMFVYIKRGVQGRMRLFTDRFVGNQMYQAPGAGEHWSTGSSFLDSTRNQSSSGAAIIDETFSSSYDAHTAVTGSAGRSSPDEFFNAWHEDASGGNS